MNEPSMLELRGAYDLMKSAYRKFSLDDKEARAILWNLKEKLGSEYLRMLRPMEMCPSCHGKGEVCRQW